MRRPGVPCRACAEACPEAAIRIAERRVRIDPAACSGCGLCAPVCPTGAIEVEGFAPGAVLECRRVRRPEPEARTVPCLGGVSDHLLRAALREGDVTLVDRGWCEAVGGHGHPFHQQLDDARLLRRERRGPDLAEPVDGGDHVALVEVGRFPARSATACATTSSGPGKPLALAPAVVRAFPCRSAATGAEPCRRPCSSPRSSRSRSPWTVRGAQAARRRRRARGRRRADRGRGRERGLDRRARDGHGPRGGVRRRAGYCGDGWRLTSAEGRRRPGWGSGGRA